MASNVWVLSSDLKRTQIKVQPSTYLSDVLDEACSKLSIDSSRYQLRHNQKLVDLSLQFRHAGLSAGAKLDLVIKSKTPGAVSVALQMPMPEAKETPGGRLIAKFPSTTTIWKVLRQMESGSASQGRNINITARGTAGNVSSGAGQLLYETPVLNIMGRELSTFEAFQKTLSQLGYNSGSVLMRLTFKVTDQTLASAMESISTYFKETEEEEAKIEAAEEEKIKEQKAQEHKPTTHHLSEDVPMTDASKTPAPTKASSPDAVPISNVEPVSIFSAPTSSTPASATAPYNEADNTPTIAQLQKHQAYLASLSQNKRLLSDQELEAKAQEKAAKLAAVKSLSIKVRFPDNTSAQWNLGPDASGATLHAAVRSQMANPTLKFRLAMLPGRVSITDDDKLLISGYKLTGGVLLTLLWDESVSKEMRAKPFLCNAAAQKATDIVVPKVPEREVEEEAPAPVKPPKKESGGPKVPKWFKMPGSK
ncbi:hypothetical protein TD95_000484 [Thielaviopsis punctulata]|uniref:TUG ubiquitin-like domain-containing protein n=1 Tax=Thielaviopsis punctulata TaxID=72032 RepID=A0A0F4ZAR8_9PEZI|nr:hypothetical protein TD95_000484 [Thielaviopsis punctulata]